MDIIALAYKFSKKFEKRSKVYSRFLDARRKIEEIVKENLEKIPEKTLIAVLSGPFRDSYFRNKTGIRLYEEMGKRNRKCHLVLSGDYDGIDLDHFSKNYGNWNCVWRKDKRLKIFGSYNFSPLNFSPARDTFENIFFIEILNRFFINYKNIAIITSESHMKRSKEVAETFFPTFYNLYFISSPEPDPLLVKFVKYLHETIRYWQTKIIFTGIEKGDMDRAMAKVIRFKKIFRETLPLT